MCGMAKRTLKEFEEVSEVSNTSLKVRIWSFLKTATCFFASLAAAPLFYTSISQRTSRGRVGEWLHFGSLSLFLFSRQSSSSFVFALITIFCHFDIATMRPSATTALETINLCKCTQLFVNMTFNCVPKQNGCLRTSHTLHS